MRVGFDERCLAHDPGPRHPESPDRIRAIKEALSTEHTVTFGSGEAASLAAIESVHDPDFVADMHSFIANGGGSWDADTVVTEDSWEAVRAAAGLAVWAGHIASPDEIGRNVPFALSRPPGHHATVDDAGGFCVFNNVAVGAQTVLDADEAERVAVVDWDVHHGDGTQEIFYERDDVAVASLHEDGLYPGTGAVEETGVGAGAGATLNLPIQPGGTPATYLRGVGEVLVPWLRRFQPDLVLISAGFDAHKQDPISRMALATETYGVLTDRIRRVCETAGAGLAFVLEGGYDLGILAESVQMVNEVCAGYDPVDPTEEVRDIDLELFARARELHGIGS